MDFYENLTDTLSGSTYKGADRIALRVALTPPVPATAIDASHPSLTRALRRGTTLQFLISFYKKLKRARGGVPHGCVGTQSGDPRDSPFHPTPLGHD
jgi:hypothetical protein